MRSFARFPLLVVLGIAFLARPAMPQAPTPRPDSTARDSAALDSVAIRSGSPHSLGMYLLLPASLAAIGVMLTLPAPVAFLGKRGEDSMAFMRNHVTISTAYGGHFHNGQTWSHAVAVEVIVKAFALDATREDYRGVRPARHTTARIGYFLHPRRHVAGGLMVGYRDATDVAETSGITLGFPFIGEVNRTTIRLDPTYVFADVGSLWHLRFEVDIPIPRTHVFAGMRVAAQSQLFGRSSGLQGQPQLASFGLVLGTTF
jgi:hypothetical protein